MKLTSALLASVFLAVSASAAMADPIVIGSYGGNTNNTGYVAPSNYANTVVTTSSVPNQTLNGTTTYKPYTGMTYDLPTKGIWAAPTGGSSWVGIDPNDEPLGSNHEKDGTYNYSTSFVIASGTSLNGSIQVMADDTTDVYLNGTLLQAAAPGNPTNHCTVMQPNCLSPLTVALTGLVDGSNTLSFVVHQEFDHASGLDFSGSIGVTPEPSSLLLLGSGLSTMAGLAFRRRRVQA